MIEVNLKEIIKISQNLTLATFMKIKNSSLFLFEFQGKS